MAIQVDANQYLVEEIEKISERQTFISGLDKKKLLKLELEMLEEAQGIN